MEILNPGKYAFFLWYFNSPTSLDNVDKILNCVRFQWAQDGELDHHFSYDPSSSVTVDVWKWYGLELFSSLIFFTTFYD